jgi:acetolactate synthase-1/3 small subunit
MGQEKKYIIAVTVDNEPGVLARVIGLFSGRGYNIESLTVTEVEHSRHLSRITIVTSGTETILEQIKAQLSRLIPVHQVLDLTSEASNLSRELFIAKIKRSKPIEKKLAILNKKFGGKIISRSEKFLILELSGNSKKLDDFISQVRSIGLIDSCRSGVVAVANRKLE